MTNPKKRCGCPKAKWPKCDHAWWLIMQHRAKNWAVSCDEHLAKYEPTRRRPETRGEADVLVGEIATAIRKGEYPPTPAALEAPAPQVGEGLTFEAAAKDYVEAVVEQSEVLASTVKKVKSRFARLARTVVPEVGCIGTVKITAVTKPVVETLYRLTTKGMSNSNKRKYRQALTNLFAWAVETQQLATSPVTKTTALPAGKEVPRTRRIYADEEANLLQAASEARTGDAATRLVTLLVLAFDLGLRHGELLALRWADVLWDEGPLGRLRVAALEEGAQKGGPGKSRRVPLTLRALTVLEHLTTSPTGKAWPLTAYVLGDATGGRVKQVRKAWVTCALRSVNHEPVWVTADQSNKLAPESQQAFKRLALHLHDVRHECAHRWLKAGQALGTIAVLLGHNDLSTLRVYLGLAEADALRDAEGGAVESEQPAGPVPVQLRKHDGTWVTVDVTQDQRATGVAGRAVPAPNAYKTRTKLVQTRGVAPLRVVGGKEA